MECSLDDEKAKTIFKNDFLPSLKYRKCATLDIFFDTDRKKTVDLLFSIVFHSSILTKPLLMLAFITPVPIVRIILDRTW